MENGADAVYFGMRGAFNARARASNFTEEEVVEVMAYLHERVRGGWGGAGPCLPKCALSACRVPLLAEEPGAASWSVVSADWRAHCAAIDAPIAPVAHH